MATRDPTQRDEMTSDEWEERPLESFDHYCPGCPVFYPASSNAHAGH
jgi:hypothetical protein